MNKINSNVKDEVLDAIVGDNPSELEFNSDSIIMVVGVGGAGGNAVNHMQSMGITGVNFVVCNTDKQALENCNVANKVQMGPGLGAGNDPQKGRQLALESEDKLRSLLETSGAKMLFIAAGMGGGTGTGASPVIARLAHECGILTVAVVTMPLIMEGATRYEQAVQGIDELNKWVDSLLIIDNEKLCLMYGKMPIKEAFGKADDILGMATKGIAELITVDFALVRVDFADVMKVMKGSGRAHMSVVKDSGENRAYKVAEASLSSPLLDDNMIAGAKNILLSFSVSNLDNLMFEDVTEAMDYIQKHASYKDEDGNTHSADIIWGASQKSSLADDELELVVVATGFADGNEPKIKTTYDEAIDDNSPLGGAQPVGEKKKVAAPLPPPTAIAPLQSPYRVIELQRKAPAYVRLKRELVGGYEPQTRATFHPVLRDEEPSQQVSAGSLFG
jgi:cell division protein FtsZ